MASSTSYLMIIPLVLCLSLLIPATIAGVICEELPHDLCVFSVSAASKHCLLESYQKNGGETGYECRTSKVVVDHMYNWIETDQCVNNCGLDRNMVGISSDSFLEPQFTASLCALTYYHNCPNVVDLYLIFAASEGTYLHDLCAARRVDPHRAMVELLSSGASPGPVVGGEFSKFDRVGVAAAPAASPAAFNS